MAEETRPDAVIQSRSHRIQFLIYAGLSLVVAVGWIVSAFLLSDVGTRIILTVVFLLLSALAFRYANASVVFAYRRHEVVIRNPFRVVTIPVTEVAEFDVAKSLINRNPQGGRRLKVKVKRTDGSTVRCVGAGAVAPERDFDMASQLNAALRPVPDLAPTGERDQDGGPSKGRDEV